MCTRRVCDTIIVLQGSFNRLKWIRQMTIVSTSLATNWTRAQHSIEKQLHETPIVSLLVVVGLR